MDEFEQAPAAFSLEDLWGAGGPVLLAYQHQDQDDLLARLSIDCQGGLVDIVRGGQRWDKMKAGDKKVAAAEAIGTEISLFMMRVSSVSYLQGLNLDIDEDSVRAFVDEWPEIHKNDFLLAVNLGHESLAALMLEYYCDPEDPVGEPLDEDALEQHYASLIGVCMVLCDRFGLDFGTVLWNACIQTEV